MEEEKIVVDQGIVTAQTNGPLPDGAIEEGVDPETGYVLYCRIC